MKKNKKQLRATLSHIRQLVDDVLHSLEHDSENNDFPNPEPADEDDSNQDGPQSQFIGCSIRQLPQRLQQRAADTAIEVYTKNDPRKRLNMLGLAQLGLTDRLSLTLLTSKYWGKKTRQLTVSFMAPASQRLRRMILEHMNAWSRTTCISFAETKDVGTVRIAFDNTGYWSYLGTDILLIPKNQPTMNLQGFTESTPLSEFKRVVCHETGHTLGFPHEHMREELVNRIDPRKAYAYFLRTQGWNEDMVNRQVLTPLSRNSIMGTPPDQTSIMCYQLPGDITKDGQPIRGGLVINSTDFAFAGQLYPKRELSNLQLQRKSRRSVESDWDASDDPDDETINTAVQNSMLAEDSTGFSPDSNGKPSR
ncbi:M12 family metallopeptidase [Hymenobacter sp. CRA2]|uniref:M12 family metallopeptidase n=1 Tax=Hymenobacter sp. CRA2 TaxID=1955620 RepID=UPI00098FC08E|nr:M12 family metallopeptidase [Hymenobacter sp. CRA2]OON68546.1 hypothetical protein B0919_12965 [Hymenobacter sp. CRA2]